MGNFIPQEPGKSRLARLAKSHSEKAKDGSVSVKVKLSPLARLYWTLDKEFDLDTSFLSDTPRYERFVRMHGIAEQKRDRLIRNVLVLDAVAMILLFGNTITIPGLNISLKDIPAAREALTLLASLSFQFLAIAFVNWLGYSAIIDMINVHRAKSTGVDADYLSASDKFMEFVVKLYRTKMNIRGLDFVIPGQSYGVMTKCVIGLMTISVYTFILLHLIAIFLSARETVISSSGIFKYVYILFLVTSNLGGILVFATISRRFEFIVPQQKKA